MNREPEAEDVRASRLSIAAAPGGVLAAWSSAFGSDPVGRAAAPCSHGGHIWHTPPRTIPLVHADARVPSPRSLPAPLGRAASDRDHREPDPAERALLGRLQASRLSQRNPWHPDRIDLRSRHREALASAYEAAAHLLATSLGMTELELEDVMNPETTRDDVTAAVGRVRAFLRKASNIRRCGWEHAEAGGVMMTTDSEVVGQFTTGRPYLYGERCSARLCTTCGRTAVARRRARLAPLLEAEGRASDFVLVTLTRRANAGESFGDALAIVMDALDKLRKARGWKATWRAGLAGIEGTWSTHGSRQQRAGRYEREATQLEADVFGEWDGESWVDDPRTWWNYTYALRRAESLKHQACKLRRSTPEAHWHVHVHLVLKPREKPKTREERLALRDATHALWSAALSSSREDCSVDMQKPRKALHEVVKYAVKGVDVATMPQDKLVELVTALEGRRLVRCLGEWHNAKFAKAVSEHEDPEVDERNLGSDPEHVVGYTLDERGQPLRPVKRRDVEIRSDATSRQVARALLALKWEAEHAPDFVAPEAAPLRPPSTADPPNPKTKVFRLPLAVAQAASSAVQSVATATADGLRRLVDKVAREEALKRRDKRTSWRRGRGLTETLVDAEGFIVRMVSAADAAALVDSGAAEVV